MSDLFIPGETVEIQIKHHSGRLGDIWLDAEYLEKRGNRIWVCVQTLVGPKKQSIALEKVRKKNACAG